MTQSPSPGQLPVTGGQGLPDDGGVSLSLLAMLGLLLTAAGGLAWSFGKRR